MLETSLERETQSGEKDLIWEGERRIRSDFVNLPSSLVICLGESVPLACF